jgi:hypothetical protein
VIFMAVYSHMEGVSWMRMRHSRMEAATEAATKTAHLRIYRAVNRSYGVPGYRRGEPGAGDLSQNPTTPTDVGQVAGGMLGRRAGSLGGGAGAMDGHIQRPWWRYQSPGPAQYGRQGPEQYGAPRVASPAPYGPSQGARVCALITHLL